MSKRHLCDLRGPNSKYCKRWCLLRCDTSTKVKKNNVLAKNGSNMSARMRYSYNIRGNFKSAGRTLDSNIIKKTGNSICKNTTTQAQAQGNYVYSTKQSIQVESYTTNATQVNLIYLAGVSEINNLIDTFLTAQGSSLTRAQLLNSNNNTTVNPTIVELYDSMHPTILQYTLQLKPTGVVYRNYKSKNQSSWC